MVRYSCCVPGCKNTTQNNVDVVFHNIPRNILLQTEWLQNIKNSILEEKDPESIRQYRVCSAHFAPEQYKSAKKLVTGACPTIFTHELELPDPSNVEGTLHLELPERVAKILKLERMEEVLNNPVTILQEPSTSSAGTALFEEYVRALIIEDTNIPVAEQAERRTTNERCDLLNTLGVTRVTNLTRRKERLYNELTKSRRLVNIVKKRGVIRALFGNRREFNPEDNSVLRNLAKLDRMPGVVKTFIQRQLKFFDKDKKITRYTNEEKALFLALMNYSPKAYRFLCAILSLPSIRTLNRSLSNVLIRTGINDYLFSYLNGMSQKMKQVDKYCLLMFDEVALASNLTFNKKEGVVQGLVDLGTHRRWQIADHALVFMIRGLHSNWKQAVAFYFVRSAANTYVLKSCIQQVVSAIHEKTEFRIVASVSDLATNNRRAVQSLADDYVKIGGRGEYIYNVDGHKIVHLFDVPNLIKCLRNNLMTKDIVYGENKRAKWSDVEQLYMFDVHTAVAKATKLSLRHIQPRGRDKMRVKYAAQVFSRSTYSHLMLLTNAGAMEATNTAEFVLFVNDLFDSLNCVTKSSTHLASKFTDSSPHLEFWDMAEKVISGLKFIKDDMIVPIPPSVPYLIHTIRNVQSLWNDLKDLGFNFLLTKNLNQDPLENFFGTIRGLCGQNTKPTCLQFASAFKTCLVNSGLKCSKDSNCEDDGCSFLVGIHNLLSPLPADIPAVDNRASLTTPSPESPLASGGSEPWVYECVWLDDAIHE